MKKILILSNIIFLLYYNNVSCQQITITGYVIDLSTKMPIQYASVGLKTLGKGTVTNTDGKFSLTLENYSTADFLTISCLGYKNQILKLNTIVNPLKVFLTPDTLLLREVVISSRDTLLDLLRNAYKNISKNYPLYPTNYQGFYRESLFTPDSLYLYFNEAVLGIYKNGYQKTGGIGQIKIEKSRKNIFPGFDSINNVLFYGGPHFPLDEDLVYARKKYINPDYFNNYRYDLVNINTFNNKPVYVIKIISKKSKNWNCTLYIDKETLAYIGAEEYFAGHNDANNSLQVRLNSYRYGKEKLKIFYQERNHKFYLGYIIMNSEGYNKLSNKKLNMVIEYVTTSIKTDTVKTIPFNEQFRYHDILSIDATPYDSSYWKDYTILKSPFALTNNIKLNYEDQEAQKHLSVKYNKFSPKHRILSFLIKRISFEYGLNFYFFSIPQGKYNLHYETGGNSLSFDKEISPKNFSYSLNGRAMLELHRKSLLYFSQFSSLDKTMGSTGFEAGYKYRMLLNPSNQYWLFDIGCSYNWFKNLCSLGETMNNANISIGNKNFNSKKITAYFGQQYQSIKPEFTIAYKKKLIGIYARGSMLILLNKKDIIHFEETSGFFLTRRHNNLMLDNGNIQLKRENTMIKNDLLETKLFQIEVGIRVGF